MKEVVLKLDYHDDKRNQEAMKIVVGLNGVDSIAMDMKDKKLTMIGNIDPVDVVAKLRKVCRNTEMVTFGPAKEPDKKEEPKKEEPKKKVVLKLYFHDDKCKQEAMKRVSERLNGVDSIAMDMKDKKLTMIGDIDPVAVATKLRKVCHTEMVMFGPAKEPDKKKEPKKEEPKKKVVLKLDYHDDKRKQEAMKIVFGLNGVDSIEMDMKDKKLTMIGDIEVVVVADKLRKVCHREIVAVTEPDKKKKEPKKEEPKKDRKQEEVKEPDKKKEPKKEEPKKERKQEEVKEPDKKKEPKKEEPKKERKQEEMTRKT